MAGKGTRHRFELSRLEIAGVMVSATAGLFVVFILGIYAGRGMTDRRLEGGEQIVRLPVAPAAEQTPGAEDGLTFYDTLGQDERTARAENPEAHGDRRIDEVPAAPSPAPPLAKPVDPAAAKPEAPAKAEQSEKVETATADAPARETREEPARRAAEPTPSPAAVAKNERASTPPSPVRVAAVPTTRSPTKGDWSVQVSATRDPRTADAVLRRLRTKGYDAFVLKVRRRGETFYRVRVGHYGSLEEAQQVVSRLRREPGVPEAFVASD